MCPKCVEVIKYLNSSERIKSVIQSSQVVRDLYLKNSFPVLISLKHVLSQDHVKIIPSFSSTLSPLIHKGIFSSLSFGPNRKSIVYPSGSRRTAYFGSYLQSTSKSNIKHPSIPAVINLDSFSQKYAKLINLTFRGNALMCVRCSLNM